MGTYIFELSEKLRKNFLTADDRKQNCQNGYYIHIAYAVCFKPVLRLDNPVFVTKSVPRAEFTARAGAYAVLFAYIEVVFDNGQNIIFHYGKLLVLGNDENFKRVHNGGSKLAVIFIARKSVTE